MNVMLNGNYEQVVSFVSIGLTTDKSNSDDFMGIYVQYERITPFSDLYKLFDKTSLVLEGGSINWSRNGYFSTFPGLAEETFVNKNDMTYLGVGIKNYRYSIMQKYRIYLGITIGQSISGEENSFIYIPYLGIEFYNRNTKISFDARYFYFSSIESEKRTFNALGKTIITVDDNRESIFSIGAKFDVKF